MLELIDLPATTAVRPDYDESRSIVRDAYARLDETSRNKRARELATILGLTEAQWVAAQCGVIHSIPLAGSPAEIFSHVGRLGEAMALTRNDFCVHEGTASICTSRPTRPLAWCWGPALICACFFQAGPMSGRSKRKAAAAFSSSTTRGLRYTRSIAPARRTCLSMLRW